MSVASDRAAELAKTHNLTKARREGAELALQDAEDRGEWPGEYDAAEIANWRADARKLAAQGGAAPVDRTATADRVAEALRARHVNVGPDLYRAIRNAL